MSNYIVSKGLGGALLIPEGYGAITPNVIAPAIISFSEGGLRISLRKYRGGAMFYYEDGDNAINYFFSITPEQLAGTDWMICKVTRKESSLMVSIGNNSPVTISLSLVKSYGGIATIMEANNGGLFDLRGLPKAVESQSVSYYMDDLSENSGKALLPSV